MKPNLKLCLLWLSIATTASCIEAAPPDSAPIECEEQAACEAACEMTAQSRELVGPVPDGAWTPPLSITHFACSGSSCICGFRDADEQCLADVRLAALVRLDCPLSIEALEEAYRARLAAPEDPLASEELE